MMNENYDKQFDLKRIYHSRPYYLGINSLQSFIASKRLNCELDIPYGVTDGQKVDVFPAAEKNSPVFIFIHGGYFKALDKKHYRFIASNLTKKEYTTVLVNYDLAPQVTVAEIVKQVIDAFCWIVDNVAQWNGDISKTTLCGHSVGAFLAAKILEQEAFNQSEVAIEKTLLLSGLYDLEPMKRSYLNKDLYLTREDVTALSPIYFQLQQNSRVLICVGEDETNEFVRQSSLYADKLTTDKYDNQLLVLPQTNHYRMMRYLAGSNNAIIEFLDGD